MFREVAVPVVSETIVPEEMQMHLDCIEVMTESRDLLQQILYVIAICCCCSVCFVHE